jgi:hypothetical protein
MAKELKHLYANSQNIQQQTSSLAVCHNMMDTYITVVDTEKFKLIPKFGRIVSSVIGCPHLPQAFCIHDINYSISLSPST